MDSSPEPAAQTASAPRKLGQLLKDSLQLVKDGVGEYAAIIALGLVPGVILASLAITVSGLADQEAITNALKEGSFSQIMPLFAAGLAAKAIKAVAFMAVVLSVRARNAGQALGPKQAFEEAWSRVWPFFLTELRAVLYIIGGYLLFIIPGIILSIRYSFVHLAVLLEGFRGKAALARSKELVIAHMGKVVGNLLVATIVVVIVNVCLTFALDLAMALPKTLMSGGSGLIEKQLEGFVTDLATGVAGVWVIAFSILLYQDLAALQPAQSAEGA